MATIIENLDELKNIKEDIKAALENKGVDMTNTPFTGYAEKINEITIDVGEYGLKFANSTLTEIPEIFDFSNVTDYSYMFTNCKNLTGSPIGDSIVIDGSGDYAFYGAEKLLIPDVTIRGNATAFNMFGNNKNSKNYALIACEGFPYNIIKGETAHDVIISLGSTRNDIHYDDNDEFLYDNIVAAYLAIMPHQEQDLQTLFFGIAGVEEMVIGKTNISYNFNHSRDVHVENIKRLRLNGDYSDYGIMNNSYSSFLFNELEYIYGCNGLKGSFYFTNISRYFNVECFKVFLQNIGSVPDGECEIRIPNRMTGQLSEDDIATATNKGYIIRQ